jgi:hypothetical protein
MGRNRLLVATAAAAIGKKKLPYSDSFARGDGAPGSGWVGTAGVWTIASNKVSNNPTLGAEVLTDPSLEGNYTAGVCDWVADYGTPTMAQSADAKDGTKAQQFTATAFNDRACFYFFAGVAKTWYLYTVWVKRTAGASADCLVKVEQNSGSAFHFEARINDAAYTQKKISYYSPGTGTIFPWLAIEQGAAGFSTVVADLGSFKPVTLADMFLTRPATQANVIVKADWTLDTLAHTHCGIVARLDSTSAPLNYLLAVGSLDKNGYQYLSLHKVVNGVLTTLIAKTYAAFSAGAYLELRCNGSTIKMYYNNAQVGTDQTVSDAGILNNTIHGVCSTDGGNKLNRFFLGYA